MTRESIPHLSRLYRDTALEEPCEWLDSAIESAARDAVHSSQGRAFDSWRVSFALAALILVSTIVAFMFGGETDTRESVTMMTDRPDAIAAFSRSDEFSARHAADADRSPPATTAQAVQPQTSDALRPPASAHAGGERQVVDPERRLLSAEESSRPPSASKSTEPAAPPSPASSLPRVEAKPDRAAGGTEAQVFDSSDGRRAAANAERAVAAESRRLLPEALAPREWLHHIAKLAGEGRQDDARESLAAFRRQYPAHRIPDELRALEKATTPSPQGAPAEDNSAR